MSGSAPLLCVLVRIEVDDILLAVLQWSNATCSRHLHDTCHTAVLSPELPQQAASSHNQPALACLHFYLRTNAKLLATGCAHTVHPRYVCPQAIAQFRLLAAVAMLLGVACGAATSWLLDNTFRDATLTTVVTLASAYSSHCTADRLVGPSGLLAVVSYSCGMSLVSHWWVGTAAVPLLCMLRLQWLRCMCVFMWQPCLPPSGCVGVHSAVCGSAACSFADVSPSKTKGWMATVMLLMCVC